MPTNNMLYCKLYELPVGIYIMEPTNFNANSKCCMLMVIFNDAQTMHWMWLTHEVSVIPLHKVQQITINSYPSTGWLSMNFLKVC